MPPKLWSQLTRTRSAPLLPPVGTPADFVDKITLPLPAELDPDAVRAAAAVDRWPIPHVDDREGYYVDNHGNYWASGLRDRSYALGWYAQVSGGAPRRVLELGAASGRVIRHFAAQDRDCDAWATDIDGQHVEWIAEHLGDLVTPVHTTALPILPVRDSSFDLVLAYSVFTHIDALETSWLAEVRRVLRPGGMALLTIHTERSWELLRPGLGLYHALLELAPNIEEMAIDEDVLAAPLPSSRLSLSWPATADVYNSVVFHSRDYVTRRWSRLFDVVDIIDEASEYQAAVLLRAPQEN
jgi:SAM-dependent methyltransferase